MLLVSEAFAWAGTEVRAGAGSWGFPAGGVLSARDGSPLAGTAWAAGVAGTAGEGADLREAVRRAGAAGGGGDGSALAGVGSMVDFCDGRFFCDIYLQRVKRNRWK